MKIVIGNQYQNDEENNEKYKIDENGNVNLFIDIDDETENSSEKSEGISINNINNLQEDEVENNFIKLSDENNLEEVNEYINLENDEDVKYNLNDEDIKYNLYEEEKDIDYNKYEKENLEVKETLKVKEDLIIEENLMGNLIVEEEVEKDSKTITVENKLGDSFKEFYESIYSQKESNIEEEYKIVNEKIVEEEYKIVNEKVIEEKIFEEAEVKNNEFNREESIFNERVEAIKTGEINILCKLGGKDGVELKGARVNLYLLNGISPKLCDSKFTDGNGRITFSNLQNGCYRIISIVDRRYFEKPSYYNWNEVTIDKNTKRANIVIVNKLKSGYYRRQY